MVAIPNLRERYCNLFCFPGFSNSTWNFCLNIGGMLDTNTLKLNPDQMDKMVLVKYWNSYRNQEGRLFKTEKNRN